MQFDRFSISLLMKPPDSREVDRETRAALQDAHLSFLADLHAAGHLLAAGPLGNETYRGLSILSVGPEETRELKEPDPLVRAGIYSIEVMPWMVPAGAVSFSPTRFPRSAAEADAD